MAKIPQLKFDEPWVHLVTHIWAGTHHVVVEPVSSSDIVHPLDTVEIVSHLKYGGFADIFESHKKQDHHIRLIVKRQEEIILSEFRSLATLTSQRSTRDGNRNATQPTTAHNGNCDGLLNHARSTLFDVLEEGRSCANSVYECSRCAMPFVTYTDESRILT